VRYYGNNIKEKKEGNEEILFVC